MLSMLDLERFHITPLTREPFEFLVVPEFVKAEARAGIDKDYPNVARAGSFPLREVTYGPAFGNLIEEMRSEEFRKAFEAKFNLDLTNRPDMITVRGHCREKDHHHSCLHEFGLGIARWPASIVEIRDKSG